MKKILTALLYSLPVIFFVMSYFLMTVWCEDIIQGAGMAPDVWHDMMGAFHHNSRLSDMYAWAVINFFNYQYSFGVDTIFRLIDVIMATGLIYLLTTLILGRRPKWCLKDATIFGLSWLVIFLTPHGYTLYRGFSVIHNYLIIGLATVGFALPFVRHFAGEKVPKIYQKWWFALLIGLIFGMSSNITPVAVLICFVLVKLWRMMREKAGKAAWRLPGWQWWMLAGMLVTLGVAYIVGAGVSDYAQSEVYTGAYDYLAFGEIFSNFGSSLVRILKHVVVNFGYTFGLILAATVILGGLAKLASKFRGRKLELLALKREDRRKIGVLVTFAVVYLLCGTQIMLPVRLALPAYLALVVSLGILAKTWWIESGLLDGALSVWIGVMMTVIMGAMVVVKAEFALDYRAQMAPVLRTIKESSDEIVCISPELAKPKKLPFVNLGQDEIFMDWALPKMTVYEKKVEFCEIL